MSAEEKDKPPEQFADGSAMRQLQISTIWPIGEQET
jgi:hypothetical protein